MTTAFVLGNGKSRQGLDLHKLREHGAIYGCNALYRDFTPDCLVATDGAIGNEIQKSGYASKNRFYTRRVIAGSGAKALSKEYRGMSSGPNALALASLDPHDVLYLIGFDLGSSDGRFNNVYADTQFYKKLDDPPTFAGNWIKQIRQICEQFPDKHYIRVTGVDSSNITTLAEVANLKTISLEQFRNSLNI
jgi:hypothetical protein